MITDQELYEIYDDADLDTIRHKVADDIIATVQEFAQDASTEERAGLVAAVEIIKANFK